MAKSTVDTLAKDIKEILKEYSEDVTGYTKEAVDRAGKKGVEALRSNSRSNFGGSGKYASGWTSKVEESRTGSFAILHNARLPGFPHLLENGHAKRGGGRVLGTVHIAPVEEELVEAFQKDIEGKL